MRDYPRHVPSWGHPLTRLIFQELADRRLTLVWLSDRSGVPTNTIQTWNRRGRSPNVANLEACLNALGYNLKAEKKDES